MSFPFGWMNVKGARRRRPFAKAKLVDPQGQRLIGRTSDTHEPLWAPKGHSWLLSSNGGGKTTAGAAVWLMSLIASRDRPGVFVADHKNGELTRQFVPMLVDLGIPFAVIDDSKVLPPDCPGRVSLNPVSAVVESYRNAPEDLVLALEGMTHALIEEPPEGPDRNKYFRDWPRRLIEFAALVLLRRKAELATPGGVWTVLSDPEKMRDLADIEAEEATGLQKALARNILNMVGHEHWPMHLQSAQDSLRIFSVGTRLSDAGLAATTTPADLIRGRVVTFFVGSMRHMSRLGPYYSMQLTGFLDALYGEVGPLTFLNDEFTNAPLSAFIDALTTIRAFGGEAHNICQSRSEVAKKFGKHAVETIEENSIVKQWFGFSGFTEAKLVSDMMGEQHAIATSLGGDNESLRLQTNLSLIKQRWMSPAELMAMPAHQQLIHVKGLGFFVADKVGQQNVDPYCHLIGENELEGGRLQPDPWITLTTPYGDSI